MQCASSVYSSIEFVGSTPVCYPFFFPYAKSGRMSRFTAFQYSEDVHFDRVLLRESKLEGILKVYS